MNSRISAMSDSLKNRSYGPACKEPVEPVHIIEFCMALYFVKLFSMKSLLLIVTHVFNEYIFTSLCIRTIILNQHSLETKLRFGIIQSGGSCE